MPLRYILFLLLFFSCSKEQKKTGFKTRSHSDLALLMMQMEQGHLDIRKKVEKGEKIKKLPFNYHNLLHSTPTFANDVDSVFIHYANNYIQTATLFLASEDQYTDYNKLVTACIKCHENKCGGPIVRIKKLYIKKQSK